MIYIGFQTFLPSCSLHLHSLSVHLVVSGERDLWHQKVWTTCPVAFNPRACSATISGHVAMRMSNHGIHWHLVKLEASLQGKQIDNTWWHQICFLAQKDCTWHWHIFFVWNLKQHVFLVGHDCVMLPVRCVKCSQPRASLHRGPSRSLKPNAETRSLDSQVEHLWVYGYFMRYENIAYTCLRTIYSKCYKNIKLSII